MNGDPAIAAFVAACDAMESTGADGPLECGPALSALVGSGAVARHVEAALAGLLVAPPDTAGDALVLARGRSFRLLARVLRPEAEPAAFLEGPAEHALLAALGPAPVDVDLPVEGPTARDDVFDPERRLLPRGRRTLAPGEVIALAAGRDVAVCRASAPTVVALAIGAPRRALRWIYDGATSRAAQAFAGDPRSSRLQFAAEVLAELAGADAAPALEILAGHEAHHVRWSALQALARVDADRAIPRLRAAADDVHPHVRAAARRALDLAKEDPAWTG